MLPGKENIYASYWELIENRSGDEIFINCEKVFSYQICPVRDKFNQNYFRGAKILLKLCNVIFSLGFIV